MTGYRILYFFSTFFLVPLGLIAQMGNPSFAKYLTKQGAYRDVIDLQGFLNTDLDKDQLDSLSFYTAWAHFHLQEIPQAIEKFESVSSSSNFFEQSMIFSSWCNLYNGRPEQAQEDLRLSSKSQLTSFHEVHQLQQAAIYLYQRDFVKAGKELEGIKTKGAMYKEQVDHLEELLQHGSDYRPKSKASAAILSAILPGAGKIYAGELGAGISNFLIMAALGGVTAENIVKSGWVSWNSLLFSGIVGAFYLGNIYGSMISIQTYRSRFNENYHQGILATVVIPLRDHYR